MPAFLLAFAWFADAAPLEMPRAEAYLVEEQGGRKYLEDRYGTLDLWTEREVLGRWIDEDGRVFLAAQLDAVPPPENTGATATRGAWRKSIHRINPRDKDLTPVAAAVSLLSPVDPAEEPSRPRQRIRGMREVLYWHGTNTSAIVATFAPEKDGRLFYASMELAEDDHFDDALEEFEDRILREWKGTVRESLRYDGEPAQKPGHGNRARKDKSDENERELLRRAAKNAIANYREWHFTDSPEFCILDDLEDGDNFAATLSNEFSRIRAQYAEAFPTPLDAQGSLAVARIYHDREEYLDALETDGNSDLEWTAAYWNPTRRELVAYLPDGGSRELMATLRHEAFHQYLSYACAMIQASPWINEGYAQYYENPASADWKMDVDFEQAAELLPAVMALDYEGFYDPVPEVRQLNYRIAWSIAKFLETGARKVRFDPFKDVKSKYIEGLLKHRDARKATAVAFGTADNLKLFVKEWKKFWKNYAGGLSKD